MFLGRHNLTLDTKGRLSIPAKFREVLAAMYGNQVILTGLDQCIVVYPLPEWQKFEEKARQLPSLKRDVRNFFRGFYSAASECALDRQGRVLIPPQLREYAGLDREVVLVGIANKMEIWSKERWEEQVRENQSRLEEIAEELAGIYF